MRKLPSTASNIIYIDVSDVVLYATLHHRVSGIQRVVLNVVRHIAATSQHHKVICIFYDQVQRKTLACSPRELLGNECEFDARAMQYRLHQDNSSGIFPAKRAIKKYLNTNGYKRLRRFAKKCQILSAALVAPHYLERLGLRTPRSIRSSNQRARLKTIKSPDPNAHLVLLGATWTWETITNMANLHRRQGGTVVQMLYDLIPVARPDYCDPEFSQRFSVWIRQAAKYASRFICISEYSANELRDFLAHNQPDATGDIRVTPLAHEFPGMPRNCSSINDVSLSAFVDRDFVLLVGTIEPRKNYMALLHTWRKLRQQLMESPPLLVIAGKNGWRSDDLQGFLLAHPEMHDIVRVVDAPSDSQLAWLYIHCAFTIFPSAYEGWGLPVGEAAWFGKYTLTANRSSLPEVLGDLVDYVDPEDQVDLLTKVLFAIKNPNYVHSKEQVIRSATLRSWQEVTKQLAAELTKNIVTIPRDQSVSHHRTLPEASVQKSISPHNRSALKIVLR